MIANENPVRHLLVVDDERLIVKSLRRSLESRGFVVTGCHTGSEALEIHEKSAFDAIICDIFLPDLDGVEVLKALRARGDQTPFVLVSGVANAEMPVAGITAGATCFITKPIDVDVVMSSIQAARRRSTAPPHSR
jgi:DNA-binding response OmpR family regulator